MTVSAIQCKKCGSIIFSRALHDMHYCPCGACAIDGGFDYTRILGKQKDWESVNYNVDATVEELYDDWNKRTNKFGIVKLYD